MKLKTLSAALLAASVGRSARSRVRSGLRATAVLSIGIAFG